MKHKVHNVLVDIETHNLQSSSSLEREVYTLFCDKVLEPLDQYITDLHLPADNVIHIPSIDIDKSFKDITKLDIVAKDILSHIKSKISQSIQEEAYTIEPIDFDDVKESLNHIQIVKEYLQTGNIPSAFSTEQFVATLKKIALKDILRALQKGNATGTDVVSRLLQVYPFEELLITLVKLKGFEDKMVQQISAVIQKQIKDEAILQRLNTVKTTAQLVDFLQSVKRDLSPKLIKDLETTVLLQLLNKDQQNTSLVQKEIKQQDDADSQEKEIQWPKAYKLPHTGLFLFLPLYNSFFIKQNLLDKAGNWINQTKAIQYLYFIATGNELPKDYELITEKILVGLQPNSLVVVNKKLTDKEKKTCLDFMLTIIKQWQSVKNSGIDFLRDMFIHRSGMAIIKKANWSIQIDKKAQDILIDKLPWGLGIQKLPWMKGLLDVKIK